MVALFPLSKSNPRVLGSNAYHNNLISPSNPLIPHMSQTGGGGGGGGNLPLSGQPVMSFVLYDQNIFCRL